jgi:hypothetical protein
MAATINIDDLPAEVREKLNLKKPRKAPTRSMTMHEVRTAAIRVLNVVADLTPTERARVLRHATKLNAI